MSEDPRCHRCGATDHLLPFTCYVCRRGRPKLVTLWSCRDWVGCHRRQLERRGRAEGLLPAIEEGP